MKKLITIGIFVGTAFLIRTAIKEEQKPKKVKKKKIKSEKHLETYDFSDNRQLNKHEKKFKKYLKQIKKDLPEGKKVVVKKREPVLLNNGMIEQAYIVDRPNGMTYIVTPEITDIERLSFAVHEGCHLRDGHQDPKDEDYDLTPYQKEKQVEKCVRQFFKKNKIRNRYKRSDREIRAAYT